MLPVHPSPGPESMSHSMWMPDSPLSIRCRSFLSLNRVWDQVSLDFEYILTEVKVYSVVPQEQWTENAVIPVDIGNIEVRVVGDIADAHRCVCAMSDF